MNVEVYVLQPLCQFLAHFPKQKLEDVRISKQSSPTGCMIPTCCTRVILRRYSLKLIGNSEFHIRVEALVCGFVCCSVVQGYRITLKCLLVCF